MLKFDLHTHTIASGHAFNTLFELVHYASQNGIEVIGITDHGPDMQGAPHLGYFKMLECLPKKLEGVTIIGGCEANIINLDGKIDLPVDVQKRLNLVIAGLHYQTSFPISIGTANARVTENTTAIIKAIQRNRIHIISHPYRPEFPIDIEKVYNVAKDYGTLLEINLSLLNRSDVSEELVEQIKLMLKIIELDKGRVVISSDAHIATMVGDDSVLDRLNLDVSSVSVLGHQNGRQEIKEFLGLK